MVGNATVVQMVDDADNPEWTEEDFAQAVPFKDAHPHFYEGWKLNHDRASLAEPKVHIGLRLAADVVDSIKATGSGYDARVEKVLREAINKGSL